MESTKDVPSTATRTGTAVVLSTTIRDTLAPAPRSETEFNWTPFWLGECNLGANNLTITSDGTAEWRAKVMSRSGGDAWGARFEFFDNHDISLWLHGWIWSPSLDPPYAVIDWVSLNQIFFPAYLFPHVARVLMHAHC